MASATFLDFVSFKDNTSVTLPRYYIVRADGYVLRVMGVNTSSGVTHIYTMLPDENVVPTDVSGDPWFAGALQVQDFAV